MFCEHCGKELLPDAAYCPNCGAPVVPVCPSPYPAPAYAPQGYAPDRPPYPPAYPPPYPPVYASNQPAYLPPAYIPCQASYPPSPGYAARPKDFPHRGKAAAGLALGIASSGYLCLIGVFVYMHFISMLVSGAAVGFADCFFAFFLPMGVSVLGFIFSIYAKSKSGQKRPMIAAGIALNVSAFIMLVVWFVIMIAVALLSA